MGRIKRFNLSKFQAITGANYFFETGTWHGDGLAYAAKYPFKKLFSSEIIPSVAERAIERFKHNKKIVILNKDSATALIDNIKQLNANCIFWLDAHFPGAEEGLESYNAVEDEIIKLPLQKELEIIASRKNIYQDIILVDDLRIYQTGEFDSGNLPEHVVPPKSRNIEFVYELFNDTHNIGTSLKDEGYLYLIPKNLRKTGMFLNLLYKIQNIFFKKIL